LVIFSFNNIFFTSQWKVLTYPKVIKHLEKKGVENTKVVRKEAVVS
jgi:hypothetical protein